MENNKAHYGVAILIVSIYLILAFGSVYSTGIGADESRYLAQGKAKAYSIYAHLTGKPDLFFCDISQGFWGTEWESRCWEGRPKASITLSGLSWAAVWFANGKQLDVLSSIAAHRVAIILLTAIGLFIFFRFTSEMFNRRVAIFSGLALIFMPRFFAHSKKIMMDEPTAIMILISLWLFWKGLRSWKHALAFGPVFGYALTFKIQSTFIAVIIPVWLLVSYRDKITKIIREEDFKAFLGKFFSEPDFRVWRILLFSAFVLTPISLILSYPWLWHDTVSRVVWWLSFYFHFSTLYTSYALSYCDASNVFCRGSIFYPFALILVTTPIAIVLLSIIGTLKALKDTVTLRNRNSFLVLFSAFVFPVTLAVTRSTYNGDLYLLQAFPFLAVLAGLGAHEVLAYSEGQLNSKTTKMLLSLVIAMSLVIPGMAAITKGHEDTYFNALIGGGNGAYKYNIELEWSGEAYLEAVHWLNSNARENSTIYVSKFPNIFRTYKYGDIGLVTERMDISSIGLEPSVFEQKTLLRRDIQIVGQDVSGRYPDTLKDADYLIVLNRLTNYPTLEFFVEGRGCGPVYSVSVDTASLVDIYEVECFKANKYRFNDLS